MTMNNRKKIPTTNDNNKITFRKGDRIRVVKPRDRHTPFKVGDEGIVIEVPDNRGYVRALLFKENGNWQFGRSDWSLYIKEIEKSQAKYDPNTKIGICDVCDKEIKRSQIKKYKKFLLCEDCWEKFLTTCNNCGRQISRSEAFQTMEIKTICKECFHRNYFRCNRCEHIFPNSQPHSNGMCEECLDEHNRENGILTPDNKRFVNEKNKYRDLPIGVELEAELEDSEDYNQVYDELDGKGFGVCEDGSLNQGVEVQIPASNGGQTEKLVEKACKVLNQYGYIRDTCGLHIHIGYPSKLGAIKNAIIMGYVSEPILYGVNPASRYYSHYCQPIRKDFTLKQVIKAKIDDIDRLLYSKKYGRNTSKESMNRFKQEKYNECRYYGFNLHSFFYRGTIEFRHHSGTLEPVKIMNWATLLKKILLYAKYNFNREKVLEIEHIKEYEPKSELLFQTIGLPANLKNYFRERYEKFNKKKIEQEQKQVERFTRQGRTRLENQPTPFEASNLTPPPSGYSERLTTRSDLELEQIRLERERFERNELPTDRDTPDDHNIPDQPSRVREVPF